MKWVNLIVIISLLTITVACTHNVEEKVVEQNNVISETVDWKESKMFKVNNYQMIGEEGRLGFIYDDTEITRFYPNKSVKYMWHFWDNDKELTGELKIIASHKESGDEVTVLQGRPLAGPNNGADQHVPSIMSLPKEGLWKLDAYIGDKLFGSIFVKVYKQ